MHPSSVGEQSFPSNLCMRWSQTFHAPRSTRRVLLLLSDDDGYFALVKGEEGVKHVAAEGRGGERVVGQQGSSRARIGRRCRGRR
eukprot:scaffold14172_cov61-Phaeocystis_antarctica.AAC.1